MWIDPNFQIRGIASDVMFILLSILIVIEAILLPRIYESLNNGNDGSRVLDNILLYQDSDFYKMESRYNKLYKIIHEKKKKK